MELSTIFDGWGTELVVLLVGLLFTGGVGFVFYKKGKINQKQKARDFAKQKQEVEDSQEKNVCQKQKAGNNAEQTQIG